MCYQLAEKHPWTNLSTSSSEISALVSKFELSVFSSVFEFRASLGLTFEFEKMAFERKRFCFNLKCNVTEDEYKDESNIRKGTYEWYLSKGEKTKFNICSNCVIADFCSKTCQEQAQFLI